MTAVNVVKLRPTSPKAPKASPMRSKAFKARMKRQAMAATGIAGVTGVLTALSLSHLAHGVSIVTSAPAWEGWATAVGIDMGFVSLELSVLMASTDALRKAISRFAKPGIVGTLATSAIMNAFAFSEGHTGLSCVPAILFGLAIPALIYSLTRIGAALYINGQRA